jgi:dTDP-6-deoxy-L-talose 4-dehydrogenase (NAD+)
MRFFLTGGSGFIGSAIARVAEQAGHQILAMRRPYSMENLPWKDIEDFRPEVCVHAAWIATPGVYPDSPLNSAHRLWSLNAVSRLAASGIRHFVALGTCLEYRPSRARLAEGVSPLDPRCLYAKEKHGLHMDLLELQRKQNFSLAWARLFFPYGPNEHPSRLFSALIHSCHTKGLICGDAVQHPFAIRDYIHVEDVATAVLFLATARLDGTFNIGTGTGIMLAEVARAIADAFGVPCHDWRTPRDTPDSDDSIVADASRLSSLGWEPHYDVRRGLTTYCLP